MLGLYRLHWDITVCLVYPGYIGTLLYAWFIQVTLGHYIMLGLYRLHWDITLCLVYPGYIRALLYAWFIQDSSLFRVQLRHVSLYNIQSLSGYYMIATEEFKVSDFFCGISTQYVQMIFTSKRVVSDTPEYSNGIS
jgi:hypothetical protein